MKIGMEKLQGLRYKLSIMGVPILVPLLIYGDNIQVIHNTQRPESILNKKSNSICYHAMRESVEMKEILTGNVLSVDNSLDISTNVFPGGVNQNHLIGKDCWLT